jgi:hypothetical protein
MSEPNKVLLQAAAFLRKHKWIRWKLHDEDGGYCARGAIMVVTGTKNPHRDDGWSVTDFKMADAQLTKHLGMDTADWNNRVAKSKAEVVRALHDAATCEAK